MQSSSFLQDLAVVMLAAGAAALLFHRLGQPKVLGYILAGLFLGPHTPPFSLVQDEATIRTLADLGVLFLMFSLGLEFNLRRFRKVGATAGVTAVLDVAVMLWLGFNLGRHLGWSPLESLFLGGMLCDSSTTILAKTLQELGKTREKFAGVVIGITVVEDVLAVGMIALLTGVAVTGSVDAGLLAARSWELVVFLVVVIVGGLLTVPRFLDYVHRLESDELLVVTVLGICFGVALVAVRSELSLALGAVLVGAVASESRAGRRLGGLVDSLRHVFSAVFFVAVGLMLDPATLLRNWGAVAAATAVVVGGKFAMNAVGSLLTGHDVPTSLRVGAGMAQVGEFAFIIAALGISLGVTSDPVYQVGVGAAVLTTLLNPYLIRWADRAASAAEASPACRRCTSFFSLYTLWIERIRGRDRMSVVHRAVRRSVVVMIVNVVLISAVMAAAGYLARHPPAALRAPAGRPGLLAAGLWAAAMLACLPMYVATIRKLQAVGMILSEIALPPAMKAPWTRTMRGFIANAVLIAGSVGLLLLTVVLSWAMLPSLEVMVLLLLGAAVVAAWRWPRLVRVYGHAQRTVMAMLEGEPAPAEPAREAGPGTTAAGGTAVPLNVVTILVDGRSAEAGKDLRSSRLRERTGTTVVGILRAGSKIMNPGPGERLLGGDQVLLLGEPDQLDAARALLATQERAGT